MTVAFVHGVPETTAIWNQLIVELDSDDVVTLSPPGFGARVPDGFAATSAGYRDWLIAALVELDGPVDLVGHDWGAGHALRTVTARPDLVRSLVTDIAGTADPSYEWHDMAKVWQTVGEGEAMVEAMASTPLDDRVAMLTAAGMAEEGARSCAEANGAAMGACILSLYRSAIQPNMTRWGEEYEQLSDRPRTLVVVPTEDHYTGGADAARRVAGRWDATVVELAGLGHWWMMQDPARGAEALATFLSG